MKDYKTLILGKMVYGDKSITITTPIDDSIIGTVPALQEDDINNVIGYAKKAICRWRDLTPFERIDLIQSFKEELSNNRDNISRIMAFEICKPIKQCYEEFDQSIRFIEQAIECYKQRIENGNDQKNYCINEPIGLILVINSFEFPLYKSISKIIPALLVGNTVILRQSIKGSLVSTQIAEVFYKTKLPNSVINIITCKDDILEKFMSNPEIDKIFYNGEYELIKKVKTNNPLLNICIEQDTKEIAIVNKDCNIKQVAQQIVNSSFKYSGQIIRSTKLICAQNGIASNLINEILFIISRLKVGGPFDDVDITALITKEKVQEAKELITEVTQKRGKVILGNMIDKNIVFPTLLDNLKPSMKIVQNNFQAPIIPVIRFDEINSVIKHFNNSNNKMNVSVYTNDKEYITKLVNELDTELITINNSAIQLPFNNLDDINNTFDEVIRVKRIIV